MEPNGPPIPETVDELLARARRLAGRTLGQVAEELGVDVPPDQLRAKGWIGQLLEAGLGASAGSRAEPDFPHLGVELKSLPVDHRGAPRESTYGCVAPIDGSMATRWEQSWVCRKRSRVLWVPIVGGGDVPLSERRVGASLLWSPSPEEGATLQADWEERSELIHLGEASRITARLGEALQIRPKAAHSREATWTLDAEANWVAQNPRGWYLRASFTGALLRRHFALPTDGGNR